MEPRSDAASWPIVPHGRDTRTIFFSSISWPKSSLELLGRDDSINGTVEPKGANLVDKRGAIAPFLFAATRSFLTWVLRLPEADDFWVSHTCENVFPESGVGQELRQITELPASFHERVANDTRKVFEVRTPAFLLGTPHTPIGLKDVNGLVHSPLKSFLVMPVNLPEHGERDGIFDVGSVNQNDVAGAVSLRNDAPQQVLRHIANRVDEHDAHARLNVGHRERFLERRFTGVGDRQDLG